MKHEHRSNRLLPRRTGRIVALALACFVTTTFADSYSDVQQLMRSGKLSEAMAKANQHISANPRDPQMRFIKGVIQRETGKTSDAITTFTKLTEDYPELPEPYNNLAVLYAGQGQYDKARAALEMAIRTHPSYATAHENLGDIYARLATQAYNKALQIDGSNTTAQPKLALINELSTPQSKASKRPAPAAPASTATAPPPPGTTPAATTTLPTSPPVAIPNAPVPTKPATSEATPADLKEVEAAVHAWANAWAAKDMKTYLGSYGKDFDPPGKMSRSAWESERHGRIMGKTNISVKVEKLVVTVNGSHAVAKFRQDYKADSLSVSSRKTLDLVKIGSRWLIVKESVNG